MKQYKRKVYIVDGNHQYTKMFLDMGWAITTEIGEADLVQFTGGEDVNPAMYIERVHPTTHYNAGRDLREENLFRKCRAENIPMAGICRGGQFLNVMCGGRLFQDVDGHAIRGVHDAVDVLSGRIIKVTSTHHQMMRIGSSGNLLTFAEQSTFREHMKNGKVTNVPRTATDMDTEAVHYPQHLVLCFQPHPEYGHTECRDYYFELIARCLGL